MDEKVVFMYILFMLHGPVRGSGALWKVHNALKYELYVIFEAMSLNDAVAFLYSILFGSISGLRIRIDGSNGNSEEDHNNDNNVGRDDRKGYK